MLYNEVKESPMASVVASRSKILAYGLIASFLLLVTPIAGAGQDASTTPQSFARQGTLQGSVFSEGMRARVANAIVKIRNLNNQKEYTSQPTDAKGNYKILMIEEGWYTLGVTTAAGDFNLNYGVYIKAGETAKLSVEMQPGGMLEGKGGSGGGGGKKLTPEQATAAGAMCNRAKECGLVSSSQMQQCKEQIAGALQIFPDPDAFATCDQAMTCAAGCGRINSDSTLVSSTISSAIVYPK